MIYTIILLALSSVQNTSFHKGIIRKTYKPLTPLEGFISNMVVILKDSCTYDFDHPLYWCLIPFSAHCYIIQRSKCSKSLDDLYFWLFWAVLYWNWWSETKTVFYFDCSPSQSLLIIGSNTSPLSHKLLPLSILQSPDITIIQSSPRSEHASVSSQPHPFLVSIPNEINYHID